MLVKYLTSLNLVPFSILQKHIFGDPWLLFLLKSNNVLCGSLCSENSSQVNRVIAAVNTQGSIFSVDIRDIGSLTKKIKYKDNVIKINCKARFESQLRCLQPAGHYQIWLISLTHHFLNHGYGNNYYLSLIRLISMFSEAVLKKFICDILEDTLLQEKCQKSAFPPPQKACPLDVYLKLGFLEESIGLWEDEARHIPIWKVTPHLSEGLLWTGIYFWELTGVWVDWAQQESSQYPVQLLSTVEICEA